MIKAVLELLFLVSLYVSLTVSQDSCVLPSYPANGGYEVIGKPNAVPGQTFDTVRLNVTCRPSFTVVGKNVVLCVDGFWSQKLPECTRSCRLDKHPSVKYRCVISGNNTEEGYRDCDLHELVGTVVKPECNAPNYYRSGVLSYMRCTDDGWDYIAVCTPECGRITSEGKEHVAGGRPAKHGELPWHAGIYTKTTTPYKQICGGSLVSTRVIISAAHCFWNNRKQELQPASQFAVAVGKLYRPWNDPNDEDAQKSEVSEIKIPNRFQASYANYQDDIAVVVLNTTIVYKTYVRPVCMDFNYIFERRQLQPGKMGKITGWGLTAANGPPSPVLNVLDTPYVDIDQCIAEAPPNFKGFITSDKFCAGYKDGKAVCLGDSGGGLVFSAVDRGIERYYLRGIGSTAPTSDDACNTFAVTTFTHITAHTSFIEENTVLFHGEVPDRSKSRINNFCTLPAYPKHGRYVIKGNPNASPGQAFPAVELNVICDPGYAAEDNVTLVCSEGWWSDNMPRCARLCKLDRHPSIQYRCLMKDKGDTRDCNNEEPPGTTIKPLCKPPYFSRHELPLMICVEGSWDNYPTCRPGCGKISPTETNRAPWHATIYENLDGTIKPKCGATLISEIIVISDNYCLTKDIRKFFLDSYFVAIGNQYRGWLDPRDRNAQYFNAITLAQQTYDDGGGPRFSVCSFKLTNPAKLTPHVSPVCLDFDVTFVETEVKQGSVGKVSSWDKEGGDVEKVFKTLTLSFQNFGLCQSESHWPNFSRLFCTKSEIDGSSRPCSVDCGTGFVVADTESDGERFYLRGVVTLFPNDNTFCTSNQPLGITILENSILSSQYIEGKTAKEFYERIFPTLGNSCPSYKTIRLWVNDFKRGRPSVVDAPHVGASITAVRSEVVDNAHYMVLADRVKDCELADVVGISIEGNHFILYKLHMEKPCARK